MTRFAYERVDRGQAMPGVIEVLARAAIGPVVEDLILVIECCDPAELRDAVLYVPLS